MPVNKNAERQKADRAMPVTCRGTTKQKKREPATAGKKGGPRSPVGPGGKLPGARTRQPAVRGKGGGKPRERGAQSVAREGGETEEGGALALGGSERRSGARRERFIASGLPAVSLDTPPR